MCHGIVNAEGVKLIIGKSSTTRDYRSPTSGRMKIVPYVIHEQAVPGQKLAVSATLRYQEKRYINI